MFDLSSSIYAGRMVIPAMKKNDVKQPQFYGYAGLSTSDSSRVCSLMFAALVGAIGGIAAYRIIEAQPTETAEQGKSQIDLILKKFFPILRQETSNPITGIKDVVSNILQYLENYWGETDIIKWIQAVELGTEVQVFNGIEFIDSVEEDGSINRFFRGNKVFFKEHLGTPHPTPFTVSNLHSNGEIGLFTGTETEMNVPAKKLVNVVIPERVLNLVFYAGNRAGRETLSESKMCGNYLPFRVGNQTYFDIQTAVHASIAHQEIIFNAFGRPAAVNELVKKLPKLTETEIIYSKFFEVLGNFKPVQNELPEREDFSSEEAFNSALRTAFLTAYPENAYYGCSFTVEVIDGYGFKDEENNWFVFDTRTEAIEELSNSSTSCAIRKQLLLEESPSLLVSAEIIPIKCEGKWIWKVHRVKDEVFYDGLESSIAINTNAVHLHELISQ